MLPKLADYPEVERFTSNAAMLLDTVRSLDITTPTGYVRAGQLLLEVKQWRKGLKAQRDQAVRPLSDALEVVRGWFQPTDSALGIAERSLKDGIAAYIAESDRKRREAQARLDEAARQHRERLQKKAERAAAKGLDDQAADLQDQAVAIVAPIIHDEVPKVDGVSSREHWHADVIDLRELVAAVAAGEVPLQAIEANDKFLNGQARALRQEMRYPGVRVSCDTIIAGRT